MNKLKVWWRTGYWHSSKLCPYKILIDCKREEYLYGKVWLLILNQVIKLRSLVWDQNRVSLDKMQWEEPSHHFCDILTKDVWPESYHKETCEKPILRDILMWNNWPIIFKSVKVTQTKERLEFVKKHGS